jgi:integrase
VKTEGEKKEKRGQRGLGSLDQHRRHWRLDITIHGKRHRIVIGLVKLLDKREARKIADERVRELMTRPEPVEQKGTMPFSEFAKKFLAWKAETNVTWRRYKGKPLDETPLKRAAAFFGDTPLKDITRGSVEQGFRVGLQMESFSGRKLKNRTVNGAVHLLRHVFYKAMEWGEAIANPAAEIEGLDEERQRPPARTIDTDEEQAKLVAELPGWLRSMVEFNLQTGARRGDLLQLTWESVHLDTGYVEFAQT